MIKLDKKIEDLIKELPDAESASMLAERLSQEHHRVFEKLKKNEGLFTDALAIAAWSPLLSTTLLQHTDYVNWLGRERTNTRVRTSEELLESLARFSLTNSRLDTHVLLSRFRRRELLRIYLRDIRKTNTLVEITEELSNLADAILQYALNISQQHLDNFYGKPQRTDERGRAATASFCIVALGKLGSLELNYASDIDLLFLYSDEGNTSGIGERGETTNKQYFVKLAEAVTKLVGQPMGEGAAYRVDLRLRPHGRDGVLASSLQEAVSYYNNKAQAWELQAMIRARSSAGDSELFTKFYSQIKEKVFAENVTIEDALSNVKLSKLKIDRQHAHDREGFNVKLGHGGIREIEFIAQALQLAFGGRDEWLRVPHTLLSLGRLAERNLITERERMELFAAYDFLRTLEHRLQMEHGLQTHSVPENIGRRLIVAKRMGFAGDMALDDFNQLLKKHTANVKKTFERVFGKKTKEQIKISNTQNLPPISQTEIRITSSIIEPLEVRQTAIRLSANIFLRFLKSNQESNEKNLTRILSESVDKSLNQKRAVALLTRISSSLEKSEGNIKLAIKQLNSLVYLCGASEYFGEMIAANPSLIATLPDFENYKADERNYPAELKDAVKSVKGFRSELSVLRQTWAKMILEIGSFDVFNKINMREANRHQTDLAEACIETACSIAKRELEQRYGNMHEDMSLAILGLGRLGGRGMDYGSDLDLVIVYNDETEKLYEQFSLQETYSKFTELFVASLSSLTRKGSVYRVDLRLRPDGKNGATCTGANSFLNYMKERAAVWELLAYVKLRFAGGDSSFGNSIEERAKRIIHQSAKKVSDENLRLETMRVRERLEKEKTKRYGSSYLFDIKYSAGGMLDVYFATRYLQLRDDVIDEGEDRSTKRTLERLYKTESLDEKSYKAFAEGYELLRTVDHNLRLIVGRSSRLPSMDHPSLEDIAKRMNYDSSYELIEKLKSNMKDIREAYRRILN